MAARVPKMTIPNMSFKETLPVRVVFKIYQLAKKHSQCMHKNSTLQVYFGFFNLNTPYLPLFQAILIIIWYTNSPFHRRLPVKKGPRTPGPRPICSCSSCLDSPSASRPVPAAWGPSVLREYRRDPRSHIPWHMPSRISRSRRVRA